MSSHAKAAKKFIADRERTAWHDQALYFVREKRDRMAHGVPEWEALRETASRMKKHTISNLAYYLEMFERNATANGAHVHWAKDAEEHNRIVYDIIQRHGGKHLIKSKSMLSEECGLTPYLEERGVEAVESDLGERIMQFMGTPPSHIVLPAIHVKREEVGKVFEKELHTEPGNSDPTYLTHAARKALRQNFLNADIAMTGVNFAVASSGAFVVCTNEGNADMGTSFPKVHIAIMGMEKVVPDYDALALYVRLVICARAHVRAAFASPFAPRMPLRGRFRDIHFPADAALLRIHAARFAVRFLCVHRLALAGAVFDVRLIVRAHAGMPARTVALPAPPRMPERFARLAPALAAVLACVDELSCLCARRSVLRAHMRVRAFQRTAAQTQRRKTQKDRRCGDPDALFHSLFPLVLFYDETRTLPSVFFDFDCSRKHFFCLFSASVQGRLFLILVLAVKFYHPAPFLSIRLSIFVEITPLRHNSGQKNALRKEGRKKRAPVRSPPQRLFFSRERTK